MENDPVRACYSMLKIKKLYAIERKTTEGFICNQTKEFRERIHSLFTRIFKYGFLTRAQTVLP
jgi:hypothetical protein